MPSAGTAIRSCSLSLALGAAFALAAHATAVAQDLTHAAFEGMRDGGFVVVIRHGKTEETPALPEDKSPLDLSNCADQLMLSDVGKEQARAIGMAFKTANIPVGKVLASGYCRAIEMARLAFGHVETSDALLLQNFVPAPGTPVPPPWPQRVASMKTLVATVPAAGTNTVLVTHFPNIRSALGLQIDYGDAVIVKPTGQGPPRLIARIFANQWSSL
jgi:phosphohistidine phosphatase SixA